MVAVNTTAPIFKEALRAPAGMGLLLKTVETAKVS